MTTMVASLNCLLIIKIKAAGKVNFSSSFFHVPIIAIIILLNAGHITHLTPQSFSQ